MNTLDDFIGRIDGEEAYLAVADHKLGELTAVPYEEMQEFVHEVRALQEQAARYREALEFYGAVASWEKTIHDQRTGYWYSKLSNDGGAIARAALAGSPDTGDQQ